MTLKQHFEYLQLIKDIESNIFNNVYDADIDIANWELTELPDWSHLTVNGNFYCDYNKLTSLKGSPKVVKGDFMCSHNKLTNLKGSPRIVNGDFYCSSNPLISIRGQPKVVDGIFYAGDSFKITNNNRKPS